MNMRARAVGGITEGPLSIGVSRRSVSAAGLLLAAVGLLGCPSSSDPGPSGGTGGGTPAIPFEPAAGGMRRLVANQYKSSVRVLFGEKAADVAAPPPDAQLHGFDAIGAAELALSPDAVAQYEKSARDIAGVVISDDAKLQSLLGCTPTGPDDAACYAKFINTVGHVAWRRKLTADETGQVVAAAVLGGKAYSDFKAGVANAISALLQSPNFIYQVEVGAPDPADPSRRKLDPNELVSRMSLFLLAATPEEKMLEAAESGKLATADQVRALAKEMLKRPEAKKTIRDFYSETFRIREIDALQKNQMMFPQWTDALKASIKEEPLRLIDDVVWDRNADVRELFTSQSTFVDPALASIYGIAPPADSAFHKVAVPAGQGRAGLLGQAAFLAEFSHASITSPTRRGNFIQSMVLCTTINPPPPGVNTQFPDDDPKKPKTMRQKLEEHQKNPSCAGCHMLMDNVGLAFEDLDAIGKYRTTEHGLPIDTKEHLDGLGNYASPKDLGAILHDDPRVPACLAKNLVASAMGHLVTTGEQGAVDDATSQFETKGYKLQDLLVEIIASPAFQYVGDPK
jgi:hypothetical protein